MVWIRSSLSKISLPRTQWTGYTNVELFAEEHNIAGLSMGGFGTLVHALSNSGKYAVFGVFSAAISLNPDSLVGNDSAGKAVDPSISPNALAEKLIAEKTPFPKAYIAIGSKDFLLEENHAFRDKLVQAGILVTYEKLPEYGHEWRFWNIEVERFLDWLQPIRTDVYANDGKRQI